MGLLLLALPLPRTQRQNAVTYATAAGAKVVAVKTTVSNVWRWVPLNLVLWTNPTFLNCGLLLILSEVGTHIWKFSLPLIDLIWVECTTKRDNVIKSDELSRSLPTFRIIGSELLISDQLFHTETKLLLEIVKQIRNIMNFVSYCFYLIEGLWFCGYRWWMISYSVSQMLANFFLVISSVSSCNFKFYLSFPSRQRFMMYKFYICWFMLIRIIMTDESSRQFKMTVTVHQTWVMGGFLKWN